MFVFVRIPICQLISGFLFPVSDGTNNYIRGGSPVDGDIDYSDSFQTRGLPVVTVLIGVFDRNTGKPVAGVVNQPFVKFDHKENK